MNSNGRHIDMLGDAPEELGEVRTYQIYGHCNNCGETGDMALPCGTTVSHAHCPKCGCVGIERLHLKSAVEGDAVRADREDQVTGAMPGQEREIYRQAENGQGEPAYAEGRAARETMPSPPSGIYPGETMDRPAMGRAVSREDIASMMQQGVDPGRPATPVAPLTPELSSVVQAAHVRWRQILRNDRAADLLMEAALLHGPDVLDLLSDAAAMHIARQTERLLRCGTAGDVFDYSRVVLREEIVRLMRVAMARWTDGRQIREDQRVLTAIDPFDEARTILATMTAPPPPNAVGVD